MNSLQIYKQMDEQTDKHENIGPLLLGVLKVHDPSNSLCSPKSFLNYREQTPNLPIL